MSGENRKELVDVATTVLGILAATFIPAYISLYLVRYLRSFIHLRYIAAAGVGLSIWYFFDTMNDAAQLDVNSGFSGGLPHLGLIIVFILGITTLAVFDYIAVPTSDARAVIAETPRVKLVSSKAWFLIPAAIAAVSGIHGLGEGWGFGTAASGTGSQSLVDAFGGLSALASYPMHKFLEAAIIAAAYSAYVAGAGTKGARWQIPVLGVLFALPSAIGATIGYSVSLDTTYFFAFGVTSALYAVLRLVEPVRRDFKIGENAPTYLGPKVFAALLIGFLLLYGAALFH